MFLSKFISRIKPLKIVVSTSLFTLGKPILFQPLENLILAQKSLTNAFTCNINFLKIPKRKGMLKHKHKTSKNSMKLRGKINIKWKHKVSNHNGLLKRIKIVGLFSLIIVYFFFFFGIDTILKK